MSAGLLRTEACQLLAAARGEMVSIVTMQAILAWRAAGQEDSRNLTLVGSMGSASSIALGLALAQPQEKFLVLDGDGSLLMQLGALMSIADQQPQNLYHVVFENGVYQTSGGQPLPGFGRSDLCSVALACGYREARRFSSVDAMGEIDEALRLDGPVLISVVISGQGTLEPQAPMLRPTFAAQIQNLRVALAAEASG